MSIFFSYFYHFILLIDTTLLCPLPLHLSLSLSLFCSLSLCLSLSLSLPFLTPFKILEATHSNIDISEIIGSNTYDFERVSQSAAWVKAINGDEDHMLVCLSRSHCRCHPILLFICLSESLSIYLSICLSIYL